MNGTEEMEKHITKLKKSIWKCYISYESNYLMFWKRQNCWDSKKIIGCQAIGGSGKDMKQSTEDF